MQQSPLISVITVVFQAEGLIERTLKSVCGQTLREKIEIVLVDGASKDRTVAMAKPFLQPTDVLISEPDKGIYDAMNKGLHAARGTFVIFINAGDELFEADTLERLLASGTDGDLYYGETALVNDAGEVLGSRRLTPPKQLNRNSLRYGMCVSHQSILARRSLCPDYDTRYRISADIDWTIRLLERCKKTVYTEAFVSKFLLGGVSSARRKQGLIERWNILSHHYGLMGNVLNHGWIALRFLIHRFTKKQH
jgi:glycosyltransferase involved in cell wall biosynthesis